MRALVFLALLAPAVAAAFDEAVLEGLLRAELEAGRMPGLRAAVVLPDGSTTTAAVGLADRKRGTPLDDEIGMPGGSTGKIFAATLAMLLVEDGVLSLDDPASRWLGAEPWFPRLPNADGIRLRHLLSHSSGIADYPGTFAFNRGMIWRVLRHGSAYFEPEELIGFVAGRDADFEPGQGFRYTDAGYLMLGLVIEEATGRDYYDLLAERILEPLGLDGIRPQLESALPDIATGYSGGSSALKKDGRMKYDPRSEWTGGGLVTTPAMLARFQAALANGRVVRPETLEAMLAGEWKDPDENGHYGYGLFVQADGSAFGHAGRWPGYRSEVTHFVASGITVAAQTNRDGRIDLASLIRRIEQAASVTAER